MTTPFSEEQLFYQTQQQEPDYSTTTSTSFSLPRLFDGKPAFLHQLLNNKGLVKKSLLLTYKGTSKYVPFIIEKLFALKFNCY